MPTSEGDLRVNRLDEDFVGEREWSPSQTYLTFLTSK